MQLPKIYGVRILVDVLFLVVIVSVIGLGLWYAGPVLRSLKIEQAHGPFTIKVANGFTEETYNGTGPVFFAGNIVLFKDDLGIQHRISGGMVIFSRYDSLGQKEREIFNALRAPIIYDQALLDSINRLEARAPRKVKTRKNINRR